MNTKAKPFIKWVGGKGQLLEQLDVQLPANFENWDNVTYIEPFVGGGAMLFYMLQRYPNIRRAIINDLNSDLTTCYRTVRDMPEELIKSLMEIQNAYNALETEEGRKEFFLAIRNRYNEKNLEPLENTTKFFFLNRTCFNGLYRVNKKGLFNVPFGKYTNPQICDPLIIRKDSELLQNVEILTGDFEATFDYAQGNTLFYFDPPYRPLSDTSSFNDYAKETFNDEAQIRLKQYCDRINNAGYHFMLSNSDCKGKNEKDNFFDVLYGAYYIERVWASRSINSNPSKRGKLTEILVHNYVATKVHPDVEYKTKEIAPMYAAEGEPYNSSLMNKSELNISGGLFIALYDEQSLKLYLDKGLYGFLMKPVMTSKPTAQSRYFAILADYACSREGTDVFFFLKRKIVYGGKIYGNKDVGSFYLNGQTSPLGRKADAELFWDESARKKYYATDKPGVFKVAKDGADKAQPFMFQFYQNVNTGKYIISDDLYFELGKYPYPLPSNSMQGMGFCTLTPGEVKTLNELISKSENNIDFEGLGEIDKQGKETVFHDGLISIDEDLVNEAQLEFTILASLKPFAEFLTDDYVLCRQVPISPFKPSEMDRADICLYSINRPIKNGTIPNVVIELKKEKATKAAYDQVSRYLKWLETITDKEDFKKVSVYIIAPKIGSIKKNKVDLKYADKIKMYSIKEEDFVELI